MIASVHQLACPARRVTPEPGGEAVHPGGPRHRARWRPRVRRMPRPCRPPPPPAQRALCGRRPDLCAFG